jgi:hypothetical protein
MWLPGRLRPIEADAVVLALGRVTRDAGGIRAPFSLRVGDCLAPRTIEAVIHEGEVTGRTL